MGESVQFVVDTPDGEVECQAAGPAAEFLLGRGDANAEREPLWHLRWCLDRLAVGESMDVGASRVLRIAEPT